MVVVMVSIVDHQRPGVVGLRTVLAAVVGRRTYARQTDRRQADPGVTTPVS